MNFFTQIASTGVLHFIGAMDGTMYESIRATGIRAKAKLLVRPLPMRRRDAYGRDSLARRAGCHVACARAEGRFITFGWEKSLLGAAAVLFRKLRLEVAHHAASK